jgi:hypothetical protein
LDFETVDGNREATERSARQAIQDIHFSSNFQKARVTGGGVGFASLEAMAGGFPEWPKKIEGLHASFSRMREHGRILEREFTGLDP